MPLSILELHDWENCPPGLYESHVERTNEDAWFDAVESRMTEQQEQRKQHVPRLARRSEPFGSLVKIFFTRVSLTREERTRGHGKVKQRPELSYFWWKGSRELSSFSSPSLSLSLSLRLSVFSSFLLAVLFVSTSLGSPAIRLTDFLDSLLQLCVLIGNGLILVTA